MCEDIVVLSIPGRLMTSPAAHMTGVFTAFCGAANSRHTLLERSPSPADHGRDSKCFDFEKATPQTASCVCSVGNFERQRRGNMAALLVVFGREQGDNVLVREKKEKQRLRCLYRHQICY